MTGRGRRTERGAGGGRLCSCRCLFLPLPLSSKRPRVAWPVNTDLGPSTAPSASRSAGGWGQQRHCRSRSCRPGSGCAVPDPSARTPRHGPLLQRPGPAAPRPAPGGGRQRSPRPPGQSCSRVFCAQLLPASRAARPQPRPLGADLSAAEQVPAGRVRSRRSARGEGSQEARVAVPQSPCPVARPLLPARRSPASPGPPQRAAVHNGLS